MPRLPKIDESSSPELARVFAEIAGSRGWVSNVMRALAHAPEGLRRFGLTEEEVESIHAGCVPDSFGGQDAALGRLALELTSGKPVSADCFAAAEQVLSPRDITDALLIAAFYTAVAMVIDGGRA